MKIHQLHIKDYFIAKNSFVAEVAFNPFKSSVTFLYPLKTSENLWFSDDFRRYRNVTLN